MDLKLTYGSSANLSSIPIEDGAIRAVKDTKELHIDLDGERVNFSGTKETVQVSKIKPTEDSVTTWFEILDDTPAALIIDKNYLNFNKIFTDTITLSREDNSDVDMNSITITSTDIDVTFEKGENGIITVNLLDTWNSNKNFSITITDGYYSITIPCTFIAPIIVTATTYTIHSLPEEDVYTNVQRATNVGAYGNAGYWTMGNTPVSEKLNTQYLGANGSFLIKDIGTAYLNNTQEAYFYVALANISDISFSGDGAGSIRLAVDGERQTNAWFYTDSSNSNNKFVNVVSNPSATISGTMTIACNSPNTILTGGDIMLKTSSDIGTPTITNPLQVFWNGNWYSISNVSQNGKSIILPDSITLSNTIKAISAQMAGKTVLLKARMWLKSSTYPNNYLVQCYNRFIVEE